jgi:hypothetical protein
MLPINYLQIFAAITLLAMFGRLLTKKNIVHSFFAGALFIAAVISISARYVPAYNLCLIHGLLLIGVLYFVYELFFKKVSVQSFKLEKPTALILAILFSAIFFINFQFYFWNYESHNILYLAPAFEILKADYLGNLRVSTHYPSELSALHLFHAAFVATIGFLNKSPNLAFFTEIKYLCIVIFFSNLIYFLYCRYRVALPKIIFFVVIVFQIYGEEISYNLSISSFIYLFVLVAIFTILIEVKEEKDHGQNSLLLLFYSIILVICKAPIFYIAGVFAFYLWLKHEKIRFHPLLILTISLTLGNMLTWVDFVSRSTEVIKNSGGFTLNHSFQFNEVNGWSLDDSVKILLKSTNHSYYLVALAMFFYMMCKYYLVASLLIFNKRPTLSKFKEMSIYDRAVILYLLASLIGVLIIRNGDGTIGHQAHAYFLASTFAWLFLLKYLLENHENIKIKLALSVVFVIAVLPNQLFFLVLPNKHMTIGGKEYHFLKYRDAEIQINEDGFYKPESGEPYWKMELQSQLSGLRIKQKDVACLSSGQLRHWVIGAEHKVNDSCEKF